MTIDGATPTRVEDFDLAWPRPFFPFQRTGIRTLLQNRSLLLADEMGLGKTIQAIAALRCLLASGEAQNALIVAPAGLLLQWRRELHLWAPELRLFTMVGSQTERAAMWRADAQVYIAGYETVRADFAKSFFDREWDVVIIDEAQRIKNPKTSVAGAVKRLKRRRSWALTGTPLENRLDDLVSVLDFVAPNRFRPERYASGLRELLGEVQLRRRRADVLPELPPKLWQEVPLALEPRQRAAYERAEEEGIFYLSTLGIKLQIIHILELILRLKQICNFCPETGVSAKLTDLRNRLPQVFANGERALVFSQFAAEPFGVKRLAHELAEYEPLFLSGDLSQDERAEAVRRFQNDPGRKLLILTLRAGGVGLNLTAASYVFHFDRWWNPAVGRQAEDRAHRIGQTRPVSVYSYLCANTIEDRIGAIIAEKQQLFADYVDGVSLHHLRRRLDLPTLLNAIRGGAREWGDRR